MVPHCRGLVSLAVARIARIAALGLGATIVFAVLAASVVLQGPRLGRLIEGSLPPNAGKMHIGGVTWHLRALVDLVTDAPSPIAVEGLQIVDPEGAVVLDVPYLEAKVKLRTLINGSFSIHELRVPKLLWRFAQLKNGDAIGFLAALAPKTPPPPPPPGAPPGPGSKFEIGDAELGDLTAVFDFPGAWGLELRHAHGTVSLIQSTLDPQHPIFGFDARQVVAEGGGFLRIMDDNVLPLDRVVINRIATTPGSSRRHPARSRGGRHRPQPADRPGSLHRHLRRDQRPRASPCTSPSPAPGDALTAVAAGKGLAGLAVTGEQAAITADLSQPFAKIKVAAAIRGLDVRYGDDRAQDLGLDLAFDGGAGRVDVTHFGLGAPGGGKLSLEAHLDVNALALDAALGLTRISHRELPAARAAARSGAGVSTARSRPTPSSAKKSARLKKIDLKFRRAGAPGLPREVRVRGGAELAANRVKTGGLTVSVAGADATARGSVDLERQLLDLALAVVAFDLGRLCGELGLPPVGKDAHVDASRQRQLRRSEASGQATVHGLGWGQRTMRELGVRFGLEHGLARLDRLSGPLFGGELDAHGSLRLWEKRASKPLEVAGGRPEALRARHRFWRRLLLTPA